jgi:SHAQKYF class myb-like DNA-binding protein
MHRLFVESIYDMGVKHASPAVIMDNMTEEHDALTAERVKSHLQKYRNNKEKSKAEFFQEYESWMQKALTIGAAGGVASTGTTMIMDMMGSKTLLGGDMAASLAYTLMAEEQTALDGKKAAAQRTLAAPDMGRNKDITGARIAFPTLTEEERKSSLGVSISHVMGLFYSMTQHLIKEREATEPETEEPENEPEPEPQEETAPEVVAAAAPSLPQHEPIDFREDEQEQELSFPRQFHDLQPAPRGYYPTFPPQQYDPTGMANHYEPVAAIHAHAREQQHEAYLQQNAFAPPSASFHLTGQMPQPQNFDQQNYGLYQESMHRYPHPY